MAFKSVSGSVDFPKMEREILAWWYESGVVEKYLHKNDKAKKRFSFLDGPITANNPMGVQHGQGRALKDLFQRYKNAQGFKQRFQNGFDCQGLWLEVQEERDLGLNNKRDIEKFGMEKFCLRCRQRVEKYSQIQTEESKRLGMFMDWDNSYYTMSEANNVYIWYFLKKCQEKGWLYKGVDAMPWCPRCGTAISKHELSDDGYKIVTHTSVYVKFPLGEDINTKLLIWTTTPWTLAANVAVAVNAGEEYVRARLETGEKLILVKSRLSVLTEKYTIEESFPGSKLLGLVYQGPFDELPAQKGVKHTVISWEEVSDADGSGLVHIAPGAGEEDFALGKKYGLPVLAPLDEFGIYAEGYGGFTGQFALAVKEEIFASLKSKGLFYKAEPITHSYPHCWRCKQELVFRATSEWFINCQKIRPLMKKAAREVNWLPESAGKRMQDWLDNMGDWPISRRRYWGLVLPFYECACSETTVVGSREELRERAVDPLKVDMLPELHRPWIDKIKIRCPKCGRQVERIKEVGDCWLDAGIVPFSTVKYLEDRRYWETWFPFDFITEYISQIKLWFYSTLFMAVTLEDKVPWKNVLATGYVVDERGEPMHKTKGNYIPFAEAAEKMGVDIMRWVYFSCNPYENVKFGYEIGDEARRRFFLPLWNVYSFFVTYANIDQPKTKSRKLKVENILDRWVLARMGETLKLVTNSLDKYDAYLAARTIEDFVSDLSLWYIRRSRDRVGPSAADIGDKEMFYATCCEVLLTLSKLLAPFAPFISEEMYKNLTGNLPAARLPARQGKARESVHLDAWPTANKQQTTNNKLISEMQLVRKICELGHAKRKEAGIRVRQPLGKFTIYNLQFSLNDSMKQLIKDELNIKEVDILTRQGGNLTVELDSNLTPELAAEGKARELVREIQDKRKELGTGLGEKILVHVPEWPKEFEDYIKKETLAVELCKGDRLHVERTN